jgi:hypothetical protein
MTRPEREELKRLRQTPIGKFTRASFLRYLQLEHAYIQSSLPRAPLPRQTGGAHKVKTKVLPRKAKHKRRDETGHSE